MNMGVEIFKHIDDYKIEVLCEKKRYYIYDVAEMLTRSSIAMKDMIEIKPMFRVYEMLIGKPMIKCTFNKKINQYCTEYKVDELLRDREILEEDLVYTEYHKNRKNLLVEIEELYEDRLVETEFSYWWLAMQLYEDIRHKLNYEDIVEVEKDSEKHRYKKGVSYVISLLYLWYGDPRNPDNILKEIYLRVYEKFRVRGNQLIETELCIEEELAQKVNRSRKDIREDRLKRLKVAPKKANTEKVMKVIYQRNPDVIAEVLERAHGICERCNAGAPFIRASDGTPYLEVHHRKRLADGGEDTVENTIAVCPNCHRELHYGEMKE